MFKVKDRVSVRVRDKVRLGLCIGSDLGADVRDADGGNCLGNGGGVNVQHYFDVAVTADKVI